MMLTDKELDEIEARANAATEGPWETGRALCCSDRGWVCDGTGRHFLNGSSRRTEVMDVNDAEFIAHARADVPSLVAEVRRLRAEREKDAKVLEAARLMRQVATDLPWFRQAILSDSGYRLFSAIFERWPEGDV